MTTIRQAGLSDATLLSHFAERTFRDTFGAVNSVEDMALHCRQSYGEEIQAREISSPHLTTLLSEDGGRLVGFAQLRQGGAPSCVVATSPVEIQRLYVIQEYHGRGVSQELMRACLDELGACGADMAWLGVWEQNPRARSFYRKFGFVEVGEHVFRLGHDAQRDIVMARPVDRPGPGA
jgi:ribosomal protein S18 acetylase RimI-like enzyme